MVRNRGQIPSRSPQYSPNRLRLELNPLRWTPICDLGLGKAYWHLGCHHYALSCQILLAELQTKRLLYEQRLQRFKELTNYAPTFCCTFCFYNYSSRIWLSLVIIVTTVDLLHREVVAMVAKVTTAVILRRISSSRKRFTTLLLICKRTNAKMYQSWSTPS